MAGCKTYLLQTHSFVFTMIHTYRDRIHEPGCAPIQGFLLQARHNFSVMQVSRHHETLNACFLPSSCTSLGSLGPLSTSPLNPPMCGFIGSQ
jgi:hypothetical protein